jgi:hypothetical protein
MIEIELRGGTFDGAVVSLETNRILRVGIVDPDHPIRWTDWDFRKHESPGLALYNRTAKATAAGRAIFAYAPLAVRGDTPWLRSDEIAILPGLAQETKSPESVVCLLEHPLLDRGP